MKKQPPITDTAAVHGGCVISSKAASLAAPSLDGPGKAHLESSVDHFERDRDGHLPDSSSPLNNDTDYQAWAHHGDHQARRQLIHALLTTADSVQWKKEQDSVHPARKLASKLAGCCAHPVIYSAPTTSRIIIHQARCKSRLCPRCGRFRVRSLREKMVDRVKNLDDPRFITLTIASGDDPLTDQIKHLIGSFRRLRQTQSWRKKVRGGWYFIEITFGKKTQQWHPHLHVIADGKFYHQSSLSKDWAAACGGSRIVDIRRVNSQSALINYVTKYVTKCQAPEHLPSRKTAEWAMALNNLRMIQSFGDCHKQIADHDTTTDLGPAVEIAYLGPLIAEGNDGDRRAQQLVTLVTHLAARKWDDSSPDVEAQESRRHRHAANLVTRWFARRSDRLELERWTVDHPNYRPRPPAKPPPPPGRLFEKLN